LLSLIERETGCGLAGLAVYLAGLQVIIYVENSVAISGNDEMLNKISTWAYLKGLCHQFRSS
jgi:hypothetical protein